MIEFLDISHAHCHLYSRSVLVLVVIANNASCLEPILARIVLKILQVGNLSTYFYIAQSCHVSPLTTGLAPVHLTVTAHRTQKQMPGRCQQPVPQDRAAGCRCRRRCGMVDGPVDGEYRPRKPNL